MKLLYKYPERLKAGDYVRSAIDNDLETVHQIERVWHAGEGHSSSGYLAVVRGISSGFSEDEIDASWCIPVGAPIEDIRLLPERQGRREG